MKKALIILLLVASVTALFVSCSDENKPTRIAVCPDKRHTREIKFNPFLHYASDFTCSICGKEMVEKE